MVDDQAKVLAAFSRDSLTDPLLNAGKDLCYTHIFEMQDTGEVKYG